MSTIKYSTLFGLIRTVVIQLSQEMADSCNEYLTRSKQIEGSAGKI